MQETRLQTYIPGSKVVELQKALKNFDVNEYRSLDKIGLDIKESKVKWMYDTYSKIANVMGMDAIPGLITTASITTPIQFLQNWLPGFVHTVTAPRKIDLLTGIYTGGAWEDAQVIIGILERVGNPVPYTDTGNMPKSSWNLNFIDRTVVRFEEGCEVGLLEAARAARVNVPSFDVKRSAALQALDISRNAIGFSGYQNGTYKTYGFLNDPGLPAYVTAAAGASTFTTWATKTFTEITNDIRGMAQRLQNNSKDLINPEDTTCTLALATAVYAYLSTMNDLGSMSVREFITKTYPRWRVESAPELNAANNGANVAYLYADQIDDGASTDGGATFLQVVPIKLRFLGIETKVKVVLEGYSNATAGVTCKRPWAVTRLTGI
jgi:hypothetical protein